MANGWIALLIPVLSLPGSGDTDLAQDPETEVELIATAVSHIREEIIGSTDLKVEVRTADPRSETSDSDYDAEKSTALARAVPGLDVAPRAEALECGQWPSTCRLIGTRAFLTVFEPEVAGDSGRVYVDIREFEPSDTRQPVSWRRVAVTARRVGGVWSVEAVELIAIS